MNYPSIIDSLQALQDEKGYLRDEDLHALSEQLNVPLYRLQGLVSFYPHFRKSPLARVEIALCRDVACRLSGGKEWCANVRRALATQPDIAIREVSCLGRCELAPAVSINEHPMSARDIDALVVRTGTPPDPHAVQRNTTPKRRWKTDPYDTTEEHYGVVTRFVRDAMDADDVIRMLKDSGLRGMGGAGFPTGLKWELVRKEAAEPKVVVCNADESEPGTFKDRVILDELPHLIVEGMVLSGLVVGAGEGIVFIRHEYAAERTAIAEEIERARQRGVLGDNVLGSGRRFDIRIFVSPGGYILGEETALLECLEDKRGEPRNKPPFPGQKGLYGKPTLINNVETFSLVPIILNYGAEKWKALGTRGYSGLKFFALSGDVVEPGVYLVPMGTTIEELLKLGGGVPGGRKVAAIAPGGASSNFLRGDALDTPLDFKALADKGSMLGSGAVLIVAEGADIVDLATNVVAFFRNESCGKCVPCRVGSEKAVAILEQAVEGKGSKKQLAVLSELDETMLQTSICGLGQVALRPFLSALDAFEDEVRARFTQP